MVQIGQKFRLKKTDKWPPGILDIATTTYDTTNYHLSHLDIKNLGASKSSKSSNKLYIKCIQISLQITISKQR